MYRERERERKKTHKYQKTTNEIGMLIATCVLTFICMKLMQPDTNAHTKLEELRE